MTDAETVYRVEVGEQAYERQVELTARGYCRFCFAPPGAPHTFLCPLWTAVEDGERRQEEVLF